MLLNIKFKNTAMEASEPFPSSFAAEIYLFLHYAKCNKSSI